MPIIGRWGFIMMTDKELLTHLSALSQKQAEVESDIIANLVEVERRSLHLKKAYRSLFEFVFDFLKCSEATASRRVAVTRAAAKFPVILGMIREQRVTLTSLALVAPHLSEENHQILLQKIVGVSKREAERVVASFSPAKPKRDVIRPVVTDVSETPRTGESKSQNKSILDLGEPLVLNSASEKKADKVRIAFDAPADLAEKIKRLKEIHAHKLKNGSLAEVLEMAVDMLLDKTAPERKVESKKKAQTITSSAQCEAVQAEARRPSAAVQREVWRRDVGQCTFTDQEGRRCSARGRLQIDHIQPWALGGSSKDPDNLRLLCQAHNLFVAEKYFPARREKIRVASLNNQGGAMRNWPVCSRNDFLFTRVKSFSSNRGRRLCCRQR